MMNRTPPPKPRILHFHFGRAGGAERFLISLAQAFHERQAEQKFVLRPNLSWHHEIEPLGQIIENNNRYLSLSTCLLKAQIRKLHKEWKPDMILAWMQRGARLLPDFPDVLKVVQLANYPKHLRYYKNADALIAIQPDHMNYVRNLGWTRPIHLITNFSNDVEPAPIQRSTLDTPENAFVVCGVGRFIHKKGFDVLIRAMKDIPDAWLWLIGEGTERNTLEGLVGELGLEHRTRFTGWVEEPTHYVASSNLFCLPSRREPLGIVTLEAWKAKVPVVATKSEGPSWYVKDGENGLLVDIDDADGITSTIKRVQNDMQLAKRLSIAGYQMLENTFSKEKIVDRYFELLADM